MFRFYRRTGPNSGYSNGLFFEALRGLWGIFCLLLIPALIIVTLKGQLTFGLVLIIGAGIGWAYLTRRHK